jgi:hypothetical protein
VDNEYLVKDFRFQGLANMGPPEVRYLLKYGIGLIGLVAIALRLSKNWDSAPWILPPLLILFAFLILIRVVLNSLPSHVCPHCSARSLVRKAVSPFGYRYFECESCGVRAKRSAFSGWEDASGTRDRRYFLQSKPDDPWQGKTLAPGDEAFAGMHGALLRNKQGRKRQDEHDLLS